VERVAFLHAKQGKQLARQDDAHGIADRRDFQLCIHADGSESRGIITQVITKRFTLSPVLTNALPLSLYVHIPWCVKKCPYCDFNSHAQNGALPVGAYIDALSADLDADLARFGDALARREIVSVFFGGGTPSLFAPDAIGAILDAASSRIAFARDAEITMETNPGTVEHGRFDEYLRAGVNRLSFGVQSFDDDKLLRLGRIHSAIEAMRAIKLAQDGGVDNINLDLM